MVASEALRRVALTPADIAGGLALSDGALWNQTADDWRVFIARAHAVGCHADSGELVATAAALPYGGALGWVSMVLVAPAWRHRGLASSLLADCIGALQARSVTPMLDATPAGAPIYRRLGFRDGFGFDRWEGTGLAAPAVESARDTQDAEGSIRLAGSGDLDALVALDAQAQGLERRFLLQDFLSRTGSAGWIGDDGRSFLITRQGRRATQLGPLVAADADQALALLGTALAHTSGPVFVDVPQQRAAGLAEWLAQRGFSRQRPFVRMALGDTPALALHATSFALAGPEFG
ncbi:MAG TPA: GNAT family N-acetyltransferase [Burkholderiaceae bacterium]|nr:GNAT family N-acetyltransferase [Burkholderiaceae bacterium]